MHGVTMKFIRSFVYKWKFNTHTLTPRSSINAPAYAAVFIETEKQKYYKRFRISGLECVKWRTQKPDEFDRLVYDFLK